MQQRLPCPATICEAMSADGEEFGEVRLQQFLRTIAPHSALSVLQASKQAVSDFYSIHERDDQIMIVMSVGERGRITK